MLLLISGIFMIAVGTTTLLFSERMQKNLDQTTFRRRPFARQSRPSARGMGLFFTLAGAALVVLYVLVATGLVSLGT